LQFTPERFIIAIEPKEREMSNQRVHRPPHSVYIINELIKTSEFGAACRYCEENEDFYNNRASEMRDLYLDAQRASVKELGMPFTEPSQTGGRPLNELLNEDEARSKGLLMTP
jgi:hypothetical protein